MGHFLFYTVSFLILSTQPKGSRPEQPARYTIFMTPRITYKPTDTASEALEIAQGAIHPFDEYAFGRAVTNGKFEAGFLDRPGNDKFIAGRIEGEETMESVIKKFVNYLFKIILALKEKDLLSALILNG